MKIKRYKGERGKEEGERRERKREISMRIYGERQCMLVCVCPREREMECREKEKERRIERQKDRKICKCNSIKRCYDEDQKI